MLHVILQIEDWGILNMYKLMESSHERKSVADESV